MLTLAAGALLATAWIPFDEQQIVLDRADPCVRLLHRDGEVGCATSFSGAVAPLHPLLRRDELGLGTLPSEGPVALAFASTLFDYGTLRAVHSALGNRLLAVLVLEGDAPSTSPAPALTELRRSEQAYSLAPHAWNGRGGNLSRAHFPFGVALLDANESSSVLKALGVEPGRREATVRPGTGPVLQMHYPMFAHHDSPTCLAAGSCLPLGGQSVWGALQPRTLTQTPPLPGRPAALLTAALDGVAFFHEHAPAADAAVSGTVALLAAVDAIVGAPRLRSQLPTLPTQLLFGLFTGEAWGGIGSRRFFRDVHAFNCTEWVEAPPPEAAASIPTASGQPEGDRPEEDPKPLPALPSCSWPFKRDVRFLALRDARVDAVLELGAVGAVAAAGQLYVHTPTAAPTSAVSTALHGATGGLAMLPLLAADSGLGLPPGPALSLLGEAAERGGPPPANVATLSDYNEQFAGGARVASRFDTADGLNSSLVCQAATVAARAWWRLGGGTGTPEANCSLVRELLDCMLAPDGCPLASSLGIEGGLGSHYSGVFMSAPGQTLISPTARFATKLLRRRLLSPACDDAPHAPCDPTVLPHDAYSTGIEVDPETALWRCALSPRRPLAPRARALSVSAAQATPSIGWPLLVTDM